MDADMNPRMFNRYAYTFNDPVNAVDPDGEFTVSVNLKIRSGRGTGLAANVGIKYDTENGQLSISPKVGPALVAGKFVGGSVKVGESSTEPAENSVSAKYSAELNADVAAPLPKPYGVAMSVSKEVQAITAD